MNTDQSVTRPIARDSYDEMMPSPVPKGAAAQGAAKADHGAILAQGVKAREAVQELHVHISEIERKLDPALSGVAPHSETKPPITVGESPLSKFFADVEHEAHMVAARLKELIARIEL